MRWQWPTPVIHTYPNFLLASEPIESYDMVTNRGYNMDTNIIDIMNIVGGGGMADAMGLCIKAIGLCGCALIGTVVLRTLFTR